VSFNGQSWLSGTDGIEDIPSEVLKIIESETGGLVQDTVALDYEHWTTRKCTSYTTLGWSLMLQTIS
jgi:hypothetical protein